MTASPSPPPVDQVEAAQVLLEKYDSAAARARFVETPEAAKAYNEARAALLAALRRPGPPAADPVGEVERREDGVEWLKRTAAELRQRAAETPEEHSHHAALDARAAGYIERYAALPPASGSDHGPVGTPSEGV